MNDALSAFNEIYREIMNKYRRDYKIDSEKNKQNYQN